MKDRGTTIHHPAAELERLRRRLAVLEAAEAQNRRECAELFVDKEQHRNILEAVPS